MDETMDGIDDQHLFDDLRTKGNLSSLKNFLLMRKAHLKPWKDFINFKMFAKPKDITHAGRRIAKNLDTYQTNYFAVCLVIVIYCIITSPLLLLALTFSMGACFYISTRETGKKISIFGRELSTAEQYLAVLVISLPIFFFASAGSTIFWIIGASVFVVTMHASFLSLPCTENVAELEEIKPMS